MHLSRFPRKHLAHLLTPLEPMERTAEKSGPKGTTSMSFRGGGSNPTGALGYVNNALKLVNQVNDAGLIVLARKGTFSGERVVFLHTVGFRSDRLMAGDCQ